MRFVLILALFAAITAAQEKSAIRGFLNSTGLNDFAAMIVPRALSKLKQTPIPDMSGSADVDVIGEVDYKLTNIKINQVDCSDVKAEFDPLRCDATGLTLAMTLDWSYRMRNWPHVSDDGSADMSLSDSSVSFLAHITKPKQFLQLSVDSTDVELKNLNVEVHGSSMSWIANLLIKVFHGTFVKLIEKEIDTTVSSTIEQMADKILSTLPTHVAVFKDTVLNLDILDIPVQKPQSIWGDFKGQFEDATHPVPFPGAHHDLPFLTSERTIGFEVSDWVANSLLWLETQRGVFDITVEQKDLPPQVPFKLNTKTFKLIFPGLYAKYPDADLRFKLGASRAPTVHLQPKDNSLDAGLEMGFEVEWKGAWVPVFMLGVDVTGSFSTGIKMGNLTWNMEKLHTKTSVLWSKIEHFSAKLFDRLLDALASSTGVTLFNEKLAQGFPLPTVDGIKFDNPKLTEFDGFVFVETNFKYSPSEELAFALQALV